MRKIKLAFCGFLIVLSGLWIAADPLVSARSLLVDYSGIVGIGALSVAMMLAVRSVFLEHYLGGLEKIHRLHKWFGITGLAISVIHWLSTQAPLWAIRPDWMQGPARMSEQTENAFQFLADQRATALAVGNWALCAVILLTALALLKPLLYRHFFKTHWLLAILYLFLVFHSVVLMKGSYPSEGLVPVMALLMIGGSAAAFRILFRKLGRSRRTVGILDEITHNADLCLLEVTVQLEDRWSGYEAGQFAFVTFGDRGGPRPFTIASTWNAKERRLHLVKELGDNTKWLSGSLKVGDLVKVEGPYGSFNFRGDKPRQIWVSVGIGITPFISSMKRLANQSDGKIIDLFHMTTVFDEKIIRKLQRHAQEAHVRLHVLVNAKDGRLNAERICQAVPEWKSGDVWFCGPPGFGQDLRRDFSLKGLSNNDFHQELFHMR